MVVCPSCNVTYPEDMTECPKDGSALVPVEKVLPSDPLLAPGAMVGEYRVDKKLGAGTFGAVYSGEQPLIGKKVAIKVLHPRFSSDTEVVSRFIAEARAVNKIRHRNIIDIFSFGLLENGQHYFVMEHVDGLTLGELLEAEGRLSVARALPILQGIAEGLDAAHEAGVTHRDLKPDNIFLAKEKGGGYFAKLLDFGVAKLVTDEMAHKTATGVAIGTPRYMSPEQSRGRRVDHRTDIYALGVVIHEVLTGRVLFEGESVMDVLVKHATEAPVPMSSVLPDLPPELDAPVLAMLAKRPPARPSSAGAAVAALAEVARSLGLGRDDPSGAASAAAARASREAAQRAHGTTATALQGALSVASSSPSSSVAPSSVATSSGGLPPGVSASAATLEAVSSDVASGSSSPADPSDDGGAAVEASGGGTEVASRAPVSPTVPEVPLLDVAPTVAGDGAAAATLRSNTPDGPPGSGVAAPPRGAGMWAALAAAAAVGLVIGGVALLRGGASEGPPAAPSAAAAPPSVEVLPTTIRLRMSVTPPDAAVLVDGRTVGRAGDPLVLPRSTERRTIRFEREGYEPQTLLIVPDRDQDLESIVLLTTVPAASQAPSAPPAAAAPRRPRDELLKPPEF